MIPAAHSRSHWSQHVCLSKTNVHQNIVLQSFRSRNRQLEKQLRCQPYAGVATTMLLGQLRAPALQSAVQLELNVMSSWTDFRIQTFWLKCTSQRSWTHDEITSGIQKTNRRITTTRNFNYTPRYSNCTRRNPMSILEKQQVYETLWLHL